MIKVAASILAADLTCLKQEVENVIKAGADWLHFDVMDYHYVPSLTFGALLCRQLHEKFPEFVLDVHLMVNPVEPLIKDFVEAGASYITIHPETTFHLDRCLRSIRQQGCKAGLAFNPGSDLSILPHVKDLVDLLVLMSVNPGFGGQEFLPVVYNKIEIARSIMDFTGLIEVDGGINKQNGRELAAKQVDVLVAGSAIFRSKDYVQAITDLKNGS